MPKRVLIVAQNFYPEFFKSNDIASELVERGYEVDVLAGIPNYPEGKFYNGYGVFSRRTEEYKGARVYRAFQIPRGQRPGAVRLSLNYISWAICATFWILFYFVFKHRYDAIIVHQTSPITQAWPALLLGALHHSPIYTWVLDIWPDSVTGFLHKPNKLIEAPLRWFTNLVYRRSKRILVSSPGFRELVNRDADYNDKIINFPNWCDDILSMSLKEIPLLPNGFKVMMAGNMSDATGLEDVVEVMKRTAHNPMIVWVFVGGGNRVEWLKRRVKEEGLERCCAIVGRYSFDYMASFYHEADVMFISLKQTNLPHLDATIPARLQSYMSAGKPVVGMIGRGVSQFVSTIEAGVCVPSGDVEGCATTILRLAEDSADLERWGNNARNYYVKHFTKSQCISNLEEIIAN